ncbi:MAG TPA: phosphatase PAP2 family protein [Gemmatimonadales bacterium]|nr:phosphatase PAP2 family protein [Gemmatimonadales bacterium]
MKPAVGLLACLVVLTAVVAAGWTAPLDQATAVAAAVHRTAFQSAVAINVTALGSAPVIIIVAVIAAAYAVAAGRPRMVLALAWTPLAFLLDSAIKVLVHHPRPTEAMIALPPDFSFPSGHAVAASALYVTLALLAAGMERRAGPRRLLITSSVLVAVLVAWSRVYLGVHYLTDVLGGLMLGTAGAIVAARTVQDREQTDRQALRRTDA